MLRDRLVCGISDTRIQRRLLSEPDLTYKRAFELAQAIEAAERNAHNLQGQRSETIHMTQPSKTSQDIKPEDFQTEVAQFVRISEKNRGQSIQDSRKFSCYRCGASHRGQECKFKDAKCFICGKVGHLAKVCRSKAKSQRQQLSHGHPSETHQLHMDEFDTELNTNPEYNLFNVSGAKTPPLRVSVLVNGRELCLEVDTGATMSIISRRTYNHTWPVGNTPHIKPTNVSLRTYTGEKIQVAGEISVEVSLNGQQEHKLSLLVVKGDGPSLLGRD